MGDGLGDGGQRGLLPESPALHAECTRREGQACSQGVGYLPLLPSRVLTLGSNAAMPRDVLEEGGGVAGPPLLLWYPQLNGTKQNL